MLVARLIVTTKNVSVWAARVQNHLRLRTFGLECSPDFKETVWEVQFMANASGHPYPTSVRVGSWLFLKAWEIRASLNLLSVGEFGWK